MAAKRPMTERQRRLGAELRKMREQAGLTTAEAAAMHGTDRTTVTNIEVARFGVSADRVRVWASNYGCEQQEFIDALAAMSRARRTDWWDAYQGSLHPALMDLAEMEHHAIALRSAQIMHMPGLLQHESYARAVFDEAVPPADPETYERALAFRMERGRILDRPEPPACTFLIHEAALHMRFGDRRCTRLQLEHLLEQSERSNVTIRVIPFAAGGFPNAGSSTHYAYGPVPQLDMVQMDVPNFSAFLHSATELTHYREVLDRMENRSVDQEKSRDLVLKELKRL